MTIKTESERLPHNRTRMQRTLSLEPKQSYMPVLWLEILRG